MTRYGISTTVRPFNVQPLLTWISQAAFADSDYTIFVWRQQQTAESLHTSPDSSQTPSPVLHLQNPSQPLPTPPAYLNTAFYLFRPSKAIPYRPHSAHSSPRARSPKSHKSRRNRTIAQSESGDSIPEHKRKFHQFHEENGVRTVIGSIGSAKNGELVISSRWLAHLTKINSKSACC